MKTGTPRVAPGPPGHWLLGHIPEFRRDVLGLLAAAAQTYGDVVRFRLGPQVLHLLNHPDHVTYVLQRQARNFDKGTRSTGFLKWITAESLLTANGDFWQRQRRLLQPAFHHQIIGGFTAQISTATAAMLERWQPIAVRGGTLDIAAEMMQATYTIVGHTLFSTDLESDAEAMRQAMDVVLPHTFNSLGRIVKWPAWFPTRANREFRAAMRTIDEIAYRIIRRRRQQPAEEAPSRDLLAMLLQARDPETGEGLTDEQLRNETVTFLLAGHETTANALTWTFHLLAQNPAAEERVRAEATEVLGGRPAMLEDIPRLSFTKMVIQETMRLFPPIWSMERRVIADDTVDGFHLPANSSVLLAPYTLHRHPEFWNDPESFNPLRFADGLPPAYYPFGAGQRFCIGSEFAMLEARIIVAMTLQSFQLRLAPGHTVVPQPVITLRTRHGLPMVVNAV